MALLAALGSPRRAGADEVPVPPVELAALEDALEAAREPAPELPEGIRAVIEAATQHIGTPYRWGGSAPQRGFDCSGLVNHVWQQVFHVALPRAARDLARLGTSVRKIADLRPGDLVFFNTRGRRNSHVGIYFGGTSFIHAPRRGARVRLDDLNDPYFARRFNSGRRLETPDVIAPATVRDP